jgi:hypothetical protein
VSLDAMAGLLFLAIVMMALQLVVVVVELHSIRLELERMNKRLPPYVRTPLE